MSKLQSKCKEALQLVRRALRLGFTVGSKPTCVLVGNYGTFRVQGLGFRVQG